MPKPVYKKDRPLRERRKRHETYTESHCWQYDLRVKNLDQDLAEAGLTPQAAANLTVDDFKFSHVSSGAKHTCASITQFIQRHEWLGKLPNRPTHRFTARLRKNGVLAGVIIMAIPNAFSHLMGPGEATQEIEKLISRGACISWSPKNLGSWLVMRSIRWMVSHTSYRLFTAYSDPEAKELGTIYQACNFYYLGKPSEKTKQYQYFDPDNPKQGWFSSREFRKRGKYLRYALELGLTREEWLSYMGKWTPRWEDMPGDLVAAIKEKAKEYESRCLKREIPPKHKYCYLLGQTKKETKELRRRFAELNPALEANKFNYPKARGR